MVPVNATRMVSSVLTVQAVGSRNARMVHAHQHRIIALSRVAVVSPVSVFSAINSVPNRYASEICIHNRHALDCCGPNSQSAGQGGSMVHVFSNSESTCRRGMAPSNTCQIGVWVPILTSKVG